ncbi:Mob1/phocein [Umbelopsis sp. AD052]|nr:Mob1/phocein [Umbelopsis sp. AD052]
MTTAAVEGSATTTSNTQLRRLYPGSHVEDTFQWPALALDDIESSFSVQEYLQQLLREDYTDIQRVIDLPEGIDAEIWQYEHLRQLCLQLNYLIPGLDSECTIDSCPEMKADGWLYLCAAHPVTKSCPAIDYIVHTLDGATMLLNNSKYFPSRISIPEPSLKHLQAIARRLYRIFAHAYFHHREAFEFFENETYLHSRFLRLSKKYSLIPKSLLIIPHSSDDDEPAPNSPTSPAILSRRSSTSTVQEIRDDTDTSTIGAEEAGDETQGSEKAEPVDDE